MKRLIVTGANGSGKSHLAARLSAIRPDIPLVSFDAMKLGTGWAQRPRAEIDGDLRKLIGKEAWILEGGPSLLPIALARAELVIWLDPPEALRLWRLARRPWKNLGRTRPELPEGNVDWPLAQYRFALRSFRNRRIFRQAISDALNTAPAVPVCRCFTRRDVERMIEDWSQET